MRAVVIACALNGCDRLGDAKALGLELTAALGHDGRQLVQEQNE